MKIITYFIYIFVIIAMTTNAQDDNLVPRPGDDRPGPVQPPVQLPVLPQLPAGVTTTRTRKATRTTTSSSSSSTTSVTSIATAVANSNDAVKNGIQILSFTSLFAYLFF